jgi:hypothetical protein
VIFFYVTTISKKIPAVVKGLTELTTTDKGNIKDIDLYLMRLLEDSYSNKDK